MASSIDLITALAAGPRKGPDLQKQLGISQPVFSRLIRDNRDAVLVVGRARATRYAARRAITDVGASLPVYEIGEDARVARVATLEAIQPNGFWVAPEVPRFSARFHDSLPYFLADLRPAGFLGRLVPRRHPELDAPIDVTRWTDSDCLRYFATIGWNLPGSLIVGDGALQHFLECVRLEPRGVERNRDYPRIIADILAHGPAGSSAAGEQPKFLATRAQTESLVKYSPPVGTPAGRRWADLLVAEHIAHEVLASHGFSAPASELLEIEDRVFLEVERFDRTPGCGRRGVLSSMALDLEYVGSNLGSWSVTARELCRQGHIDEPLARRVRELELFGSLIANTDMHAGNLSYFTAGEQILDLAPSYDMLPMLYAPRHNEVSSPSFEPPTPEPTDGAAWHAVGRAAVSFWERFARHEAVSDEMRGIARTCAGAVGELEGVAELLPR